MKTLLLIEPGFKEYKEFIIKNICKTTRLVIVEGLNSIINYDWLLNYDVTVIRVDYSVDFINEVISTLKDNKIITDGASSFLRI